MRLDDEHVKLPSCYSLRRILGKERFGRGDPSSGRVSSEWYSVSTYRSKFSASRHGGVYAVLLARAHVVRAARLFMGCTSSAVVALRVPAFSSVMSPISLVYVRSVS